MNQKTPYSNVSMNYSVKFSIVFTTLNNPPQLTKNIEILLNNFQISDSICEIFIINHNNNAYGTHDIDEDSKLKIINQSNLGGSGGFSRGMFEAFKNKECSYVILMDDDALLNIDSIIKIHKNMSETLKRQIPQIFGSIIKDIKQPDKISITGDYLNTKNWSLVKTSPDKAQFCGWWMTAIPKEVYQKIGLPLPLFLKWDDIEYGLRANKAGFKSEILKDVYVLHPTWYETEQRYSWQSYFWQRNKMITALLYGKKHHQNGLLLNLLTLFKLLIIKRNTSAFQIRILALKDLFDRPLDLFNSLKTKLPQLKDILNQNKKQSLLVGFYEAISVHFKLYSNWDKLADNYKNDFKNLTSNELWVKVFDNKTV